MAYNSVADIRKSWGAAWSDASDEEVLGAYAKATKRDPGQVADAFGYDPGKGSLTNERLSASADNYQSGMWGVGSAIANQVGLKRAGKWMGDQSDDNKFQADVAASRARELGGIDSFRDVTGLQSGANWVGGLAASSLPFLAETATFAAANAATGGALTPAWLARAATAAPKFLGGGGLAAGASFAGRRAALAAGERMAGTAMAAGAATYPSSVGDILSNQREQLEANGQDPANVNLPAALAGAIPYSLLNVIDPTQRLAAGGLPKRAISALDGVGSTTARGFGMGVARTAANAGVVGVKEGVNELGQEMVNQRFGRMAVDPNQKFYDDSVDEQGRPTKFNSSDRFAESFVGGLALGGAVGGGAGGWRRSDGYQAPSVAPEVEQGRPGDLLAGADSNNLIAGDYSPLGTPPPNAFQDGSYAEMMSQKTTLQNVMRHAEATGNAAGFYEAQSALNEINEKLGPLEDTARREGLADDSQMGLFGSGESLPEGPGQQRNPALPTYAADAGGYVATDRNSANALQEPGALLARQQQMEQKARSEEQAQAAQKAAQARTELAKRAANVGLDSKKGAHVQAMGHLEQGQTDGLITNDEAGTIIGSVVGGASPGTVTAKLGTIRDTLKLEGEGGVAPGTTARVKAAILAGGDGKQELREAQKAAKAAVKEAESKAEDAKVTTAAIRDNEPAPVTPPAVTPAPTVQASSLKEAANVLLAPEPAPAPAPKAAPITLGPQNGKGGVTTVKFGGRTVTVAPLHWSRLKAVLGLDNDGHMTGQRQTYEQVAQSEDLKGKNARSTILKSIALFLPPRDGMSTQKQLNEILADDSAISSRSVAVAPTTESQLDGNEIGLTEDTTPTTSDEMGELSAEGGAIASILEGASGEEGSGGTGYRVSDSLSDAASGDHIGQDQKANDYKRSRPEDDVVAARKLADQLVKSAEKAGKGPDTVVSPADIAAREALEARNLAITAENERLAATPAPEVSKATLLEIDARDEWNDNLDEGELEFNAIDPSERGKFVQLYQKWDKGEIPSKEYRERLQDISDRANGRPSSAGVSGIVPSGSSQKLPDVPGSSAGRTGEAGTGGGVLPGGQGNPQTGGSPVAGQDVTPLRKHAPRSTGEPVSVTIQTSNGSLEIADSHKYLDRLNNKIKKFEDLSACLR